MNKKKIALIAAMLSTMLITGTLIGCKTNSGTSEPIKTEGETKTENKPEPNTNTKTMETIVMWTNAGGTKDLDLKLVEEFNNKEGKEKGIKLEYKVYGSDFKQALDVSLASGQAPELFSKGNFMPELVRKKAIMPIEELPGGKEYIDSFGSTIQNPNFTYDGKVYNVPFNVNNMRIVYNKDLFKKAGIVDDKGEAKAPKTWAEVKEYAKKITNPSEKIYGIAFPMKWNNFFAAEFLQAFYPSIGHTVLDHRTGKYDFMSYKPAFEWLLSIKGDKSFFPGPEGLDNDPARAQFSEGKVGMKLAGSWDVGVYNDQFPAKCDWGVALVPVFDSNMRYMDYMGAAGNVAVNVDVKEASKEKQEKVLTVLKWFNSDLRAEALYSEAKVIPFNADVAKNAKVQPTKKNFKDFSDLTNHYSVYPIPSVKVTGDDANMVYMKIWTGKVSVEEGLKDLDARYNAALEADISSGAINKADIIDPNAAESMKILSNK